MRSRFIHLAFFLWLIDEQWNNCNILTFFFREDEVTLDLKVAVDRAGQKERGSVSQKKFHIKLRSLCRLK